MILFSNNLLLTSYHSERAIMFRAANNREYGVIIEGSFRWEPFRSCAKSTHAHEFLLG
jgi:hypothetical protein